MGKRTTSMQQQKGKPGSAKAMFLRAADKLLRETVAVTARENVFPKRTRWQFAYSLMDIANSFHTWVSYANGITVTDHALFAERYQAQSRGIAWLYALDVKMTAAQLCMDIPAEKLDFWAECLVEAKNRTKAWQSADKRRYEAKFGSLTAEELREQTVCTDPGVALDRSPNPSNANNVRNSNTDGSLNNNNANNTNGVVADRENARIQ